MSKYSVMFFTDSNHATQFMSVEAKNKADAKNIVRAKFNEQVNFLAVIKL